FFYERGEVRRDGYPRVVRVGTHALRPSKTTLWGRLSQHRGNLGGAAPGGGNHRGSIFRKHVGSALIASGTWPEEVRNSWGVGSTANRAIRAHEQDLEREVSQYIGDMPFLWLDVNDPPGPLSDRGTVEAGAIALLSGLGRSQVDEP